MAVFDGAGKDPCVPKPKGIRRKPFPHDPGGGAGKGPTKPKDK